MRKLVEYSLCIILFLCVGLSSKLAFSEEFRIDRFFVIGDSLSDAGTYSQGVVAGSGGLLPNIQYRFTNNNADGSSRVWAELLSDQLGLTMGPDVINGVPLASIPGIEVNGGNYAEGGARVSQQPGIGFNPGGGITTLPATEQVDRLLADVGGRFGKNDFVAIWAGANDGFAQYAAFGGGLGLVQANQNMALAGAELASQIDRLNAAGAKNILVITVPDLGITPFGLSQGTGGAAVLSGLTSSFNNELKASLRGKNAVIVDSTRLLQAVISDPLRYGFTSPNAATVPLCGAQNSLTCITGVGTATDGTYIFADGVHPTTQAHMLFAQAGFAGLQAATQNGAIAASTLTALRQHAISLENRLNLTAFVEKDKKGRTVKRKVGDVEKYASIEGGYYSADTEQVRPGLEATTQIVKFGADMMVAPNALVGLGVSLDHGQVDYENDLGGFDSRLYVGALFTNIALSKSAYINAVVGGGYVDVYNIDRSFNLGPARESYDAETTGLYKIARIGGGVMLPIKNWVFTPSAALTYESVKIDGYSESSGAASLSYGDNEFESVRLTAALTGYYKPSDPNGWSPMFRVSLEHDFKDEDLEIQLGPDSDTLGKVVGPRPDGTYGYVTLGLNKAVGEESSIGISATSIISRDGQQGITGHVSYKGKF